jgi:hypothetical protein
MGKGQMCTLKRTLDACLSSPRVRETELMLTFLETGDSLLKFSQMFRDLSSWDSHTSILIQKNIRQMGS